MNITYLNTREELGEGRNYGIGFSIYHKINKNDYEAVIPFTACRDYLNDITYVENTKNILEKIYGFKYNFKNILYNKRTCYVGVNTLHYKGGQLWNNFNKANELLIKNYKILEYHLNEIESKLNLKIKSKIIVKDNNLFIKTSRYWLSTASLISAYTLIIRLLFHLDKKYNFNDLISLLKSVNYKPFINDDSYFTAVLITFLTNLDHDYIKNHQYDKTSCYSIHNEGIVNYINNKKLKIL